MSNLWNHLWVTFTLIVSLSLYKCKYNLKENSVIYIKTTSIWPDLWDCEKQKVGVRLKLGVFILAKPQENCPK